MSDRASLIVALCALIAIAALATYTLVTIP